MVDASEWSTLSWGLRSFQKCIIVPAVRSFSEKSYTRDHNGNFLLINGQSALIGMLISPADGGYEQFCDEFERNSNHLSFSFHLCIKEQSIYHEMSNIQVNQGSLNKQVGRTFIKRQDDGIFIWTVAPIRVNSRYADEQMTLTATLALDLNESRQSRIGTSMQGNMDLEERTMRMLLDVNRFRPTRIPSRELTVGVFIIEPVQVTCKNREMDTRSTLLQVRIDNKCRTKSILVEDLLVDMAHSTVCSLDEYGYMNAKGQEPDIGKKKEFTISTCSNSPFVEAQQKLGGVGFNLGNNHIVQTGSEAGLTRVPSTEGAGSVIEGSVSDGDYFSCGNSDKFIAPGLFSVRPVSSDFDHDSRRSNGYSVGVLIEPESSYSFSFIVSCHSLESFIVSSIKTPFVIKYSFGKQLKTDSDEPNDEDIVDFEQYLYEDKLYWTMGCSHLISKCKYDEIVNSSSNGSPLLQQLSLGDVAVGCVAGNDKNSMLLLANPVEAEANGFPLSASFKFVKPEEQQGSALAGTHDDIGLKLSEINLDDAVTSHNNVPSFMPAETLSRHKPLKPVTTGTVGEILTLEVSISNHSSTCFWNLSFSHEFNRLTQYSKPSAAMASFVVLDPAIHIRFIGPHETIATRMRILPLQSGVLQLDSLVLSDVFLSSQLSYVGSNIGTTTSTIPTTSSLATGVSLVRTTLNTGNNPSSLAQSSGHLATGAHATTSAADSTPHLIRFIHAPTIVII